MNRISIAAILAAVLGGLLAVPVQAASSRTYVASYGSDANTTFSCDFAHPCRTFQTAFSQTTSGGEILAVDGSGYGLITIDRSVSIIANPGAFAGIGVFSGGTGITIDTAGVKVVLRGLTLNGQNGSGANGINLTNGAQLTLENCVVAGFASTGVVVNAAASVRVTDTTIRDNGNHGLWLQNGARATVTRATISGNTNYGVIVAGFPALATTTADIADSTIDGNGYGIYAWSQTSTSLVKVSVRDSRLVRNLNSGAIATSSSGASVTLSVSNNIISNNFNGIVATDSGSKVWASGNTVSDNSFGLWVGLSGIFESAGNNAVRNSIFADTTGLITVIATK